MKPLNIAVLTVSDTRELATDTSGQYLCDTLVAAGHHWLTASLSKMIFISFVQSSQMDSL